MTGFLPFLTLEMVNNSFEWCKMVLREGESHITNKGGHGQSGQCYATLATIIVT